MMTKLSPPNFGDGDVANVLVEVMHVLLLFPPQPPVVTCGCQASCIKIGADGYRGGSGAKRCPVKKPVVVGKR